MKSKLRHSKKVVDFIEENHPQILTIIVKIAHHYARITPSFRTS